MRNANGNPVRVLINASTARGGGSTLWERTSSTDGSETITVPIPEDLKGKPVIQLVAEQDGKLIYRADARKLAAGNSIEEFEADADSGEVAQTPGAPPEPELTITSAPSGAIVALNGTEIGVTPLEAKVPPFAGAFLVVRKEGYSGWTQEISLKIGDTLTIKRGTQARESGQRQRRVGNQTRY